MKQRRNANGINEYEADKQRGNEKENKQYQIRSKEKEWTEEV